MFHKLELTVIMDSKNGIAKHSKCLQPALVWNYEQLERIHIILSGFKSNMVLL